MAATTSFPIEHPQVEKTALRDFRQEVTGNITYNFAPSILSGDFDR
jgi:hypothetical protein